MKKYKLIKEYPFSPKLGTISNINDNPLDLKLVTKYPEFWQEIPEYEILKFQDKSRKNIYNVLPDGHLLWDIPEYKDIKENKHACDVKEALEGDIYGIYSVKRLSDGEIFTVGDLVNYNQKSNYGNWKIDNFCLGLGSNKILARSKNNCICEFIEDLKHVVEQDYEILSFIAISKDSNGKPSDINFDGKVQWSSDDNPNWYKIDDLLKDKIYAIHSIKRLSDGEIFTIGDIVIQTKPFVDNNRWTIKEFSLKDTRCFTIGVNITCIKKVKKPLFVTEDGVEIYEISNENPYFQLTPEWYIYEIGNPLYERRKIDKFFSTQTAAIEYRDLNKPKYSIQNIIDASSSIAIYPITFKTGQCYVYLNKLRTL